MATKAEIMEALLAQKNKGQRTQTTQNSTGDNAAFPFWNMNTGSEATVRFLPDKDPNNLFFWVKREVIKLPFDGVEGGDYPTTNPVEVTVPCVEMWGDTCPIISATRPWWKDPAMEATARTYWKKKSYIFQGFVVDSPLTEANLPENPIRRFVISPQIFGIIEKSLMDPTFEEMPSDFLAGVDFKISKGKQGEFANYAQSSWARKPRSLNEQELVAIDQFGLFNLADYQGERPDADRLAAIKAMFEDSVAGKPFDYASFGQYYRAYGNNNGGARSGGSAIAAAATTTSVAGFTPPATIETASIRTEAAATVTAPVETPAAAGSTPNAHEILERIKNRTMNKG